MGSDDNLLRLIFPFICKLFLTIQDVTRDARLNLDKLVKKNMGCFKTFYFWQNFIVLQRFINFINFSPIKTWMAVI